MRNDIKQAIEFKFWNQLNKLLYDSKRDIEELKHYSYFNINVQDSLTDEYIICVGIRYHTSVSWDNRKQATWKSRAMNEEFTFKFIIKDVIEHHIMLQNKLLEKLDTI